MRTQTVDEKIMAMEKHMARLGVDHPFSVRFLSPAIRALRKQRRENEN